MAAASVDDRVRDLLGRMTLEEKAGQLVQYASREDMTGPASSASLTPEIKAGAVGSLLNVTGVEQTRKWQQFAVESSRLHIPLLFGYDVIHGYRTIFPIPLGTAASWDLARIEKAEHIAATEAAAAGVHWTFAPMVDIARDPRWGRISEGSGEDTFLGSAIAAARVRGFQGTDLAATDTILACAKHFVAYGAATAGRDYSAAELSERTLREVYLPPFKAAADAGAATFMAAFEDLDGVPCHANAFTLDRVLRQEWGFKGFVVSDWGGVRELVPHGVAADLREAARRAMLAGVDMDMESIAYGPHMAELVKSGAVPQERLDAAAGAILAMKIRLGLLDDPFRYDDAAREKATLLRPDFLAAARDVAAHSCVLLKNEGGTLPLKPGALKVALVGPLADAPLHQLGSWHGRGEAADSVTVRTAFAQLFPNLQYAAGCDVRGNDESGLKAAVAAASASDVVVAIVGEDSDQTGEATSRAYLDLSGPQEKLLTALHATGKPLVVVLMVGRPLTIERVEPLASAIVVAWQPGTMAGPAVGDVLTGAVNPSGHLPVTWPRTLGQVPLFYNEKSTGRPNPPEPTKYASRYIDAPNTPLYPFGFGLSYTTFAFDHLRLSTPKMSPAGGPLTVTVQVRNTGTRAGEEVVQLYVRDRVGSVTRPVRELKGFRKLELAPGEARDVQFQLSTADLSFWRSDLTFGAEPGKFDVYVGDNADARLTAAFELLEGSGVSLPQTPSPAHL